MCFAPQRRALFRHLNCQKWSGAGVFCTFWLGNVLRTTPACTFSTSQLPKAVRRWGVFYILTWKCASRHNGVQFFDISTSKSGPTLRCFCTFWLGACNFLTSQLPKVVRSWCVFYILTWKCASRHNGVQFFDIWTSKSGPRMVCFVHFDLEMCFAPQRRALFRHRNLQKWREHVVFCTFWLGNVLRATTACTFPTSEPPKLARTCRVLYILTWKCASRHNGVQFFDISTSKSGPELLCFVHFDLEMCFAPQRRALFRHLNFQKWSENGVFCTFWLGNVLRATTACNFSTSQLPKVVRSWCVLYILTWKCASRHNGVQFFDIWISKSGPRMVCFVHFDFEVCFAPQRRTLFQHPNLQKWREHVVLCTFWLGNVLRATTACTFSTSQLPKVVRSWCVLYLFTSNCASRHNGVQFFISHLASWLRTRRFSEPTFRPSGAPNHWKNTVFHDFPTLSRICIFFLLLFFLLIFLFSLPLPSSAFHLSILSEVWLQNVFRQIHCTKLHDTTCSSCASFGPSVDLLSHPCIIAAHFSYIFLSSKLLPPTCAALLFLLVRSRKCDDVHVKFVWIQAVMTCAAALFIARTLTSMFFDRFCEC